MKRYVENAQGLQQGGKSQIFQIKHGLYVNYYCSNLNIIKKSKETSNIINIIKFKISLAPFFVLLLMSLFNEHFFYEKLTS